jgi:DNA-binding protein H-NS
MTKTYAQIAKEIQALQAQAQMLRKAETQGVIAKLNESIARYGLSVEDLHFPGNEGASSTSSSSALRRTGRTGASSRAAGASSGDAKYNDGPGRVWGGRGPRPAWLREAMAQGRSLESFAVTGKTRGTAGVSAPTKVSLPPLYSHPKTGQTWSGRGPKPAWLKQGLKKRGASIDDFLISARESKAASAPSDAVQTPAPQKTASAGRTNTSKGTHGAQAKTSGKAAAKPLAQKIGERTQAKETTSAKPAAASAGSATAPVKKAASGKSARAAGATSPSNKPQQTAKKATGGGKAEAAGGPVASSSTQSTAPAKKSAASVNAQTNKGSKTTKPPVQKTAPARKNLPTSMAPPPAAPTPAPSVESTAEPTSPAQPDTPSAPETITPAETTSTS